MKQNHISTPAEVKQWFAAHVALGGEPYTLDQDQATAVANNHKNTLVTARAGSGKTRVIVAKIAYLVAKQNISPQHITAFVFNRTAAAEINQRLTEVQVDGQPIITNPKITIATTFHKFALDVLKQTGSKPTIIKEDSRNALISNLIQNALPPTGQHPLRQLGLIHGANVEQETLQLISQFINRAQQKYPGDIGLKKLTVSVHNFTADRTAKRFYQFALPIYEQYCAELDRQNLIDFNILMYQAAGVITNLTKPASTPVNAALAYALRSRLSQQQYLLIDEYQDFSYLFLNIINKLRTVCPAAHLFAVGDDWQAINRFAGSDCTYFLNFPDFFPEDSHQINLLTNYRSDRRIVQHASDFMDHALATKNPTITAFSHRQGRVIYRDPARTRFDADDIKCDRTGDARYQSALPHCRASAAARLLKTVTKIIQQNAKSDHILLLHRHNFTSYIGATMSQFHAALRTAVTSQYIMTAQDFDAKVSWLTIHRSKGLESDVVIILEATDEILFGTHAHANLFTIFGDTATTNREDQNRLYYVALTRAKHKLYLLRPGKDY